MRRRARAAGVAVVALVVLTACSDESPTAPRARATSPAAAAGTVTVEIPAFRFDPDPVRIKAGTAVVWHNAHDQAHTSTGAGAMPWNTGTLAPGRASAPVTFAKPGTYPYICALHPFMKGTVEVQA